MRRDGASAPEILLARLLDVLGLALLVWTPCALIFAGELLPAHTAAAGLLAGAIGAAAMCVILASGHAGHYRPVLELGLSLLGAAALALLVWGAIEGRAGALASGATLLAVRFAAGSLARYALRGGYRPRWFSPRQFETMVAVADTMLDADGREAITPQRAAMRTDALLASIDAPVRTMMRLLLIVLEWVFPLLLVGRPIPFSALGARSRRVLVERLIRPPGWWPRMVTLGVRSMPRALKVLTCAGYYGDPLTMRAVGFVEFEGSPRSRGVDLTPKRYPDPHRNGRVAGAGTGADARAVVIGSGASGSVMAYELARRGLEVTVLERGRHEDPQTFEHDEAAMFARLYKHGGLQTAADNNTAIFQGCTVGGSTVINNAIWLRPPDLPRVLGEWERAGAQVPEPDLLAAYAELEAALHVGQIDKRVANPGTDVFLAGCAATPQTTGVLLENNRDRCTGCGWCNYGCRYNRKTSMLVTYVPWAQDLGVELLDQVLDVRIERNGAGRVVGVQATRDGQRISLQAEKVIVCAGAIGSSALLLENGITAGGNVGKHLHALGGVFVTGDMGQVIDGFAGIGLTCMAETAEDYRMESYFAPPLAFSVRVGGWLLSHFERVERYRHFIDGGVMVGTDPTHSSVSLSRGKVKIQLVPSARDIGLLKRGLTRMSEIYFAAGARRVYPSTFKYIDLLPSTYAEVIEQRINGMDDILFGSAHPQGGNVMSGDPAKGVVDEGFQVHGVEGLYVADTSVWPTNIRANCQATAMAMAHYAAGLIAPGARPSPAPQQAPLQASQQTPQQTPQPSHQAGGAA